MIRLSEEDAVKLAKEKLEEFLAWLVIVPVKVLSTPRGGLQQ